MTNLSLLVPARGRWLLALPLAVLLARPAQAQLATYGPPTDYSTGAGSRPWHVAVADVNGDGKPDLITANGDTHTVGVLLGNGNGTFQPMVAYSAGANNSIRKVAVADVNADGKPDVLTANSFTNTVGVLLGNGNGTFRPVVTYSSGGFGDPFDLVAADVNGDGKLDVLTANYNTSSAGVLLGNGDGTFQAVATYPTQGANPTGIAAGDINSDGKLDIVTTNTYVGGLFAPTAGILLGNGNGTFQSPTTVRLNSTMSPILVDLNGDGNTDALAGGKVLMGNGSSLFRTPINSPNNSNFIDVNGDGRLDIISTSTITLGNGDGTFEYGTYYGTYQTPAPYNTGGYVYYVAVADVSGDGKPDIIAVHNNDEEVTVVLNTTTYAPDLVVNYTTPIAVGRYNSITVNGPGVVGLAGPVTVNGAFTIGDGATLSDGCFVIDGPGSFTLAVGGKLQLCAAQGIGASGATGAVQVAGPRSFSTDASYTYLGNSTRTNNTSRPQSTGDGLPGRVRTLTSLSAAAVTLTAPTSIAQTLVLASGNLLLNGQNLTLLSSATGTAQLVRGSGGGRVVGPATVQRYLDPSKNSGLGYRHLSSPVASTTVADLATPGFAPVVNPAYNTAADPASVVPFPTVFGYDQALVNRLNTSPAFDKGFFSPASPADPLIPGRGYAVQIGAGQVVDFVGELTQDPVRVSVARNAAGTLNDNAAGWQLLGNPYPYPLDFSRVSSSTFPGFGAAVYVQESSGPYAGAYRTFVNGIGSRPFIAIGQGFFMRLNTPGTTATFDFSAVPAVRTYANQVPLYRTSTDPRPQVQLALTGAGLSDTFTAYAETGATPAFDADFDAAKLPNPTGLNLNSTATTGESLAIEGRPAFTAATVLPLAVGVPAAGSYAISAALANLPAGLDAYLADDLTGQTLKLSAGASYTFSATAAQAATAITGRFRLLFRPTTALATVPGLTADVVGVYPNPAHERFTVVLPGLAQATTVQAELLNGLGQVVRHQAVALPPAGTQFTLDAAGLATGVYTLRLQAGATTLAKRVVVQ